MRNERIHLIIRNIELLLTQLKKEVEETPDDEWLDDIINSSNYEWGINGTDDN